MSAQQMTSTLLLDDKAAFELVGLLETARAPCRILDANVAAAFGIPGTSMHFTESINDASTLVPDNMYWTVGARKGRNVKAFATIDCGKAAMVQSNAYHPALALSAAIIRMILTINKLNKEK